MLFQTYSYQITSLHGQSTRRCRTFLGNASCMLLIGFELACAWYLFVTCMNRPLYWNQTISLHADFKERSVFDWPSVLDSVHLAKSLWWVVAINANSIIEVLGKESNLWLEDPFLMVESCALFIVSEEKILKIERGLCQPARTNGSICESISDLFWNKGTRNSERAYYFKLKRQGTSNCWNFSSRFQYLKNPVAH